MIRIDIFEKEPKEKKVIETPKPKRPTTVYFRRSNRAVITKSNYSPSISKFENRIKQKTLKVNKSEYEGEKFRPTVRIKSSQADRVRRLDCNERQDNYMSSSQRKGDISSTIETFKSKLMMNKSTNLKNISSLLNPGKFKNK